jgi:hypothetical protein
VSTTTQLTVPLLDVDPPDDEPVEEPVDPQLPQSPPEELLLHPPEEVLVPPELLPEPLEPLEPLETVPEDPLEDPPGSTSLVLPPHASNAAAQRRRTAKPRYVRAATVVVMDCRGSIQRLCLGQAARRIGVWSVRVCQFGPPGTPDVVAGRRGRRAL